MRASAPEGGFSGILPETRPCIRARLQSCRKPNKIRPGLYRLRKNSCRAVGRGFIPGIRPMESTRALAPEARFSGVSPEKQPFSAACLAPEGRFSGISPETRPFSKPVQSCRKGPQNNGLHKLRKNSMKARLCIRARLQSCRKPPTTKNWALAPAGRFPISNRQDCLFPQLLQSCRKRSKISVNFTGRGETLVGR
jgi:hypothetical protein